MPQEEAQEETALGDVWLHLRVCCPDDCSIYAVRQLLNRRNSECDSPLVLTNYTLDYLEKQWASDIDFVICEQTTGGSAMLLTEKPS